MNCSIRSLVPWVVSGALSVTAFAEAPKNIWVEGEDAVSTNFRPGPTVSIAPDKEIVSGGVYLRLQAEPDWGTSFFAEYAVTTDTPGDYDLWVSVGLQNVGWLSPLTVQIDGQKVADLAGRKGDSPSYGNGQELQCTWINLGRVPLGKGEHRLRFETSSPRASDGRCVAFIDAFFFTTEANLRPVGSRPPNSPQPSLRSILSEIDFDGYKKKLNDALYRAGMGRTFEGISPAASAEVIRKLKERPLPPPGFRDSGPNEFGVHGMEAPFIKAGKDPEKIQLAYELLARVGVQSLRTAESCWHRLGPKFDKFTELDFQIENATKYGMTHLFTVGYPSRQFTVGDHHLSAVKPELEGEYREYLRTVFTRYKDKGVKYAEMGNEVDAPDTWWRGATPEQYVTEMRILKEELTKLGANIQTVAFGATYSRDEVRGGTEGGRRFVEAAFKSGIDKYADAYSIHYTWPIKTQDFPAFMNRQIAQYGQSEKPLLNTEESAYGKPSDLLKLFARDFFLYGMKRVDYYLAQDWFESGRLYYSGLFDLYWNPKPRLLAYASSVDAMKNRELVGMAQPAPNVEAYVLRQKEGLEAAVSSYAIVLWRNGEGNADVYSPRGTPVSILKIPSPIGVKGIRSAVKVVQWDLSEIPLRGGEALLQVTDEPMVVFTKEPPAWPLMTVPDWLKKNQTHETTDAPPLPGK